mmetsp:Transcript_109759/g.261669  ORF Transcript_109759/g.261669 Transcript_109759/m.261669 type:complete len:206 (+) Transcript_109759:2525-3142(+)
MHASPSPPRDRHVATPCDLRGVGGPCRCCWFLCSPVGSSCAAACGLGAGPRHGCPSSTWSGSCTAFGMPLLHGCRGSASGLASAAPPALPATPMCWTCTPSYVRRTWWSAPGPVTWWKICPAGFWTGASTTNIASSLARRVRERRSLTPRSKVQAARDLRARRCSWSTSTPHLWTSHLWTSERRSKRWPPSQGFSLLCAQRPPKR